MESMYDLHQHTHCVIMHIGKTEITTCIISTSSRYIVSQKIDKVALRSSIYYNKQKTDVTCFGWNYEERGEDDIVIDHFRDRLYNLFKKDKGTWKEEDNFLMKAVSDYLSAAVKKTMKENELKIENFDLFHYAFVVPSEWEEEIRDDLIRPIFVQSGLISNEDHQDRLLFFTDVESICYKHSFKRGENTILCRLSPDEENTIIKFDLIQTTTTLFDFPNAKFFPKVMNSSSFSVTYGDIQDRIKDFLRENLFPVGTTNDGDARKPSKRTLKYKLTPFDQNQIIKAIIKGINSWRFPSLEKENKEEYQDEILWITIKEEWMLSESQEKFITSLLPSIICAKIGTFLIGVMKDIISNNFTKSYRFLLVTDNYSGLDLRSKYDIKWLKYILEYNRRFLKPIVTITRTYSKENEIRTKSILRGAGIGVFEAIQHSDVYCKPRIVSSVGLTTSSSVFLKSKPDAIISLDISLGSTLFTCSLLDEDGSIQQIFNHDYFIEDKDLPPLGHFYTFSNTTTLNVKEQFIPFAEKYLIGDLSDFTVDNAVFIKKDFLLEMKALLTNELFDREVLVSTDEQKYIKAFILMYMIYIKEEILYKLPEQLISNQMEMKIGYAVSIEAILLNNTIKSKDNLRDIIFTSGLIPKDDTSKKLRITTQGERVLPAIQKSLELELSLKSYFLLCQLHEDYVQLSLHQVVTALSSEEKYQESIVVQDEIIAIQNIYDSLCSNMWYNLLQDSSLIELCEMHKTCDNNIIINLFSSKVKTEFFANLKGHISDNIFQNIPGTRSTNAVKLTSFCNCKVQLTTSDILDISFTPVLQDIACILYASLLNKELFGNYMNVDYLFSFIRFNNNPQLQYAFSRILEQEADDFNLELGIDTSCLVVPELFSQLLQPVIAQQPFCYKDFKIGALQQVCSENYVFNINQDLLSHSDPIYKSKIADKKTIECGPKITFPLLNKGDVINNVRSSRRFYLRNCDKSYLYAFYIVLYKFKTMNYLKNNETLSLDDNIYQSVDRANIDFTLKHLYGPRDNIPVMVSVNYASYISTLQFFLKLVVANTNGEKVMHVIEAGEPLTLTRL